jgi:hypothetical protein
MRWHTVTHGRGSEGGNWRIEWVVSTLHTTSEHVASSITTADAHTSAASSRLNWRPRRFKWTLPFRRKTKSGFCACVIAFQTQSTTDLQDFCFTFWRESLYFVCQPISRPLQPKNTCLIDHINLTVIKTRILRSFFTRWNVLSQWGRK